MMRWRLGGVCADTLSLTPLLRYDGHMEHALSPTPDARDAHALQLHVGDRVGLAGEGRGSLEPSTDDGGGDAAWREAIERRRPACDQGPVAVGTWADLLVVNGALRADVTMLRQRHPMALVMQDGLADARTLRPACRDGS